MHFTSFANINENQGSYFFVDKHYYPVASLGAKNCKDYSMGSCDFEEPVEEELLRVYKLFNVTVTAMMRNTTTGKLISPFHCLDNLLDKKLRAEDVCKDDRSLLQFLKEEVSTVGLPEDIIRFWGIMKPIRPFFEHSFLEFVADSNEYKAEEADESPGLRQPFMELVNGSSILPEAIHNIIKKFGDKFKLVLGADVHRIERKGEGVVVVYR